MKGFMMSGIQRNIGASKSVCLLFAVLLGCCLMVAKAADDGADFYAYYTKLDTGQDFEKYSRTGDYTDIVVHFNDEERFVFQRGSSYLPYWEAKEGKWYVEQIVPRTGDGTEERPDKVNTYSYVRIIKNTDKQVEVHWRYLSDFKQGNPNRGIKQVNFVDEYYTITPERKVTREVKKATEKISDWQDPMNKVTQIFTLSPDGIKNVETKYPSSTVKAERIEGIALKKSLVAEPVRYWKFDEGLGDRTKESITGHLSDIPGPKTLWRKGVSGTAIQFDGYNTEVNLPLSKAPDLRTGLTLEAWIAVGAYPWNWCPIVQQGDEKGYFLGMDADGHIAFKISAGYQWNELLSEQKLDPRRWYHTAGTYDKATGRIALYLNGKQIASKIIAEQSELFSDVETAAQPVKIGKGRPRAAKYLERMAFESPYSFDGLIDEVKIYDKALSQGLLKRSFQNYEPAGSQVTNPALPRRVLPASAKQNRFGAKYTKLSYHEAWDNIFRLGKDADIVVDFNGLPTQFIFWHGAGYIPMIVSENNNWYSNEFCEIFCIEDKPCKEPMSDTVNYHNHVRILENTDARVLVHWRYPLIDIFHNIGYKNSKTGWGEWADWYYYIYPDGIAAVKMVLWSDFSDKTFEGYREWQETLVLYGPGRGPENIVQRKAALTMANTKGEYKEYDWGKQGDFQINAPNNISVQKVSYVDEYDPFIIIKKLTQRWTSSGGKAGHGDFLAWNHWPVALMKNDGRKRFDNTRAGHTALSHLDFPFYEKRTNTLAPYGVKLKLEGMTKLGINELVSLSRSWNEAPKLTGPKGCLSSGYEKGQRAYVLELSKPQMSFKLEAAENAPLFNPCFVVKNWGGKSKADLKINGKTIKPGENFRQGVVRDTDGRLKKIIWIKMRSNSNTKFAITKNERKENN